jgi:DNA-binding NtrC family response regulator
MCAPLGIKGAVKGIVYADSRHIADSFSYPDLLFLIAISQYVHLGLSSTKLLNSQKVLEQKPKEINSFSYEMLQLGLVGNSKKLQQTYQQLEKVSKKELPILIQGETGTGKELFAKAAHKLNPKRVNGPFVAINIAALSETIIESELFGHERGAFSGANQTRIGKLEQANEGTLFLDEVAEIPLKIQAKLLRVLETGEFERVGGTKKLYTNVRLISATNKSLEDFIKKGEFREDLYYRLKGATINIPALRERSEDIPLLVEYFLTKIATTKNFTPKALSSLQNYSWPGNIRQLLRLVEELDAICDSTEIDVLDLPSYINNIEKSSLVSANFLPLNELIAQVEYDYIQRALALAGGNNDKAIEMLGISRAKFFDRKKAYGL